MQHSLWGGLFSLFTIACLVIANPFTEAACRHGLFVKAAWQAGELRIEAFYDDDTPAIEAKITVADVQGTVLARGLTNDQGVWRVSWRQPGKLTIRCDTRDGHRASTTLEVPAEARDVPAPGSTALQVTDSAAGSDATLSPDQRLKPSASSAPTLPPATDPLPSRLDLTGTPWSKVLLGLALIAFLGLAVRQMLRPSNRSPASESPPPGEPRP